MPDAGTVLAGLTALSAAIWVYLLFFRGGFWRADQRLPEATPELERWPDIAAVIPARNEADVIGRAVTSLLTQDYPGRLDVFLADDQSTDGTADAARAAAAGQAARLHIVTVDRLPAGWAGKVHAMWSGAEAARAAMPGAGYFLFTDADIEHDPVNLRRLAAKAEAEGLAMATLMVRLHCRGFVERLLIPAFLFFFQKLYPFRWIADPGRRMAGAAGGCMLVRRDTLTATGGIEGIRDAIIDDCALARQIKPAGPIWLGLSEDTCSIRPYDGLGDIWKMVARSAYTQLGHNPLMLLTTVVGMIVIYLVPPAAVLAGVVGGDMALAAAGASVWAVMGIAATPTLRLYRMSPLWGLVLPAAGLLYTLMTVHSAIRHWAGRGGAWKGRTYP